MKYIFIIFFSVLSLSCIADDISITVNNKQYIIVDNYERPYTVQIDEDTFFESYDLQEVIDYLNSLL